MTSCGQLYGFRRENYSSLQHYLRSSTRVDGQLDWSLQNGAGTGLSARSFGGDRLVRDHYRLAFVWLQHLTWSMERIFIQLVSLQAGCAWLRGTGGSW